MSRTPLPVAEGSMGELLRTARLAKGWSQVETVTRARTLMPNGGPKISQGVYSEYELGKRHYPDRRIVAALAQALEIDSDELISRTGWDAEYSDADGFPRGDSLTPFLAMEDILRIVDRMNDKQLACVLHRAATRVGRTYPM